MGIDVWLCGQYNKVELGKKASLWKGWTTMLELQNVDLMEAARILFYIGRLDSPERETLLELILAAERGEGEAQLRDFLTQHSNIDLECPYCGGDDIEVRSLGGVKYVYCNVCRSVLAEYFAG